MSKLKRFIYTLIVCLLLLAWIPSARAEEVVVSITAAPTELTDTGMVEFTFEIANYNANYPMLDVRIGYLGSQYDVLNGGEIPPSGSARDIKLNLQVSESQLDQPILFDISWTRSGEPMTQQASIVIRRAEEPVISVTRTADRSMAKPGDEIVLTYTIQNNTKFDMTGVTVIDENVSDNPILTQDKLQASGTYTVTHRYTMGEESVISQPFVTYTVNGKTKTYTSTDPLELTMVLIRLNMKIEAGTPTPSGVNFTFVIKNTGTQEIRDIKITDERANLVNEAPFSLKQNESTTLSYLVVPIMTEPIRNVQFTLAGTDSLNQAYTLSADQTFEVYPFVDDSQISVVLRAETVTPWSGETGNLAARVIVTNHSSVELTSVTLMETTIGVVKSIETLPAGETSFDLEVLLGVPRNLSFVLKGYDPTGVNRELASVMLPVAYSTATDAPVSATPVPMQGGNGNAFSSLSGALAKILIVLGVLMVISFIVLVMLSYMEHNKSISLYGGQADEDDDDDFFEVDDDEDGIDEHTFTGAPNSEEISYTQRMLALQRREAQVRAEDDKKAPIALPEPKRADKAHVLVEYDDEAASYTSRVYPRPKTEAPVRTEQTKPSRPDESQTPPRVYEYRAQPTRRRIQKQTIVRVASGDRHTEDK